MVAKKAQLNSDEHVSAIQQMNDLNSLIKLQLNPGGDVDKNIIRLIDHIPHLAEDIKTGDALRHADDLLIAHAQWLLKDEWEKVMREARMFGWVWASCAERTRRRKYNEFCLSHDVTKFSKA